MTDFHFDEVIDRRRTDSIKFDFFEAYSMPEDAIPLWVADMDFRSPPAVIDALKAAADFGVFGYTYSSDRYFQTVCRWFAERHGWNPTPDEIVPTPGVMFAAATAVRVLTRPGDAVLIQQPVYYPFQKSIEENGRVCIVNELCYDGETYSMDFDDFERKIVEQKVRLFLLCSPHNPVGRVWTGEELTRMAAVCRRHDVFVVADEIHADLVLSERRRHRVFASLDPETAQRTAVLTAPTKTFNLPGLHVANAFIPNAEIRRRFADECRRLFYYGNDLPGLRAARAAYSFGGEWLDALLIYLRENVRLLTENCSALGRTRTPRGEA